MVPLRSSPIKLPDNLYIAFSYIVHYPDHGERAAYTGLQPTPASWLRGTYPHLLHSCEAFSTCFSWHNLTPPYVPFGIRRFFTMDAFRILRKTLPRHLLQPSICRSALLYTLRIPSYLFKGSPILLFWFYAFVPTNGSFQLCRLNKVWSFPIGIHALGTTTSADFSRQALLHHGTSNHSSSPYVRETSSDKGINFQSYVCSIYTNRPE